MSNALSLKQAILALLPSYNQSPDVYSEHMLEQILNKHIPVYLKELRRVCMEKPVSPWELTLLALPASQEWLAINASVFKLLGIKPLQLWAALALLHDLDNSVGHYKHHDAAYIRNAFNGDYVPA